MKCVQFQELVGAGVLDGVEMGTTRVEGFSEDSNVIRFRLNGVVFEAIEDPDDGYRSSLHYLGISDATISNVFSPVPVSIEIDNGVPSQRNCTLAVTDVANGLVILRVGTDNDDDYYPWFVAEWMPQNMAVNR